MNHVRILTDDESDRWDAFVATHKEGGIYHTSSWRNIIRDVYGHVPFYLVIDDGEGRIRAGLPAFFINSRIAGVRISSLPGAHFCNPLIDGADDFAMLLDAVQDLMQQTKTDYFELKTSQSFAIRDSRLSQADSCFSNYVLEIDRPLETLMGTFHKSCTQRVLKNIDKSGLRLLRAESVDDLKPFYRLYLGMRRRYGLLPQPFDFFATMWKLLSPQKQIEIYHAEYQGEIISSGLFLSYRDTVTYDYGASDFDMLQMHPSHFILWTAIKNAHEREYRRFDFGRTSDDNIGLTEFKTRWGTTRVSLNYYYLPEVAGLAVMRHGNLPKKIMNHAMKLSPGVLCQMMGKVLYRNFV